MEPELICLVQPPRLSRTRIHPAVWQCGAMEQDRRPGYKQVVINADDAPPVGHPSPPTCSSGTLPVLQEAQEDLSRHRGETQEQRRCKETWAPGACPIPASEERDWAWLWHPYVRFRLSSKIKLLKATLKSQKIPGTCSSKDNASTKTDPASDGRPHSTTIPLPVNNSRGTDSDGRPHSTTIPLPVDNSREGPQCLKNHQDSTSTGPLPPSDVLSFWLGPTFSQQKMEKYQKACRQRQGRTRTENLHQKSKQAVNRRISSKAERREIFGRNIAERTKAATTTTSATKALKSKILQSLRDQAGAWQSGVSSHSDATSAALEDADNSKQPLLGGARTG